MTNILVTELTQDHSKYFNYLGSITDLKNCTTATMCDIEGHVDKTPKEGSVCYHGYIRTIQVHNRAVQGFDTDGIPYSEITYMFDMNFIDLEVIKDYLKPLWTIWANPSFDFGWLGMDINGKIAETSSNTPYLTRKIDDVQQLARLAYPRLNKSVKKFALDNLIKQIVKVDVYKDMDKKANQLAFSKDAVITEEMLNYGCADVYYLYDLWTTEGIQRHTTNWSYRIDMLNLRYSLVYQHKGILVHIPSVKKELTKAKEVVSNNISNLKGVNSNSPKQVKGKLRHLKSDKDALLIFMAGNNEAYSNETMEEYHLAVKEFSKENAGKANEKKRLEFRTDLLNNTPTDVILSDREVQERVLFATTVFNQRRAIKKVNIISSLNTEPNEEGFGKVRTFYNPYGTVTGRFSSKSFDFQDAINSQQISRDLQYITKFNTKDTTVIDLDYSTAELRSACSLMADEQMRTYLLNGVDLHKVSATLADSRLNIETVNKEQRQAGKAISFGYIFGMGYKTFIEYCFSTFGVLFTEAEAKVIKKNYLKMYKQIADYHSLGYDNWEKTVAKSPSGRVSMALTPNAWINYATQSAIADVTKLAVHKLVRKYGKVVLDYIFNVVHDALYLRVPTDEAQLWADRATEEMLSSWFEYLKFEMFKFKDIPMGVEYSYKDSKGDYISKEVFRYN